MIQQAPFSPKQIEFIINANAKYNLAHGAVRTGKTVCTVFKFLQAVDECPGESIAIFGYSMGSVYTNVVSLLQNSDELSVFRPFCNWSSKGILKFAQKSIVCIGAGDEGALGKIQGMTLDLCLCDEMTLYPDVVISMIQTRLSREHSKLYAAMNPKQPTHQLKQWIDKAEKDSQYYALHFTLDDNPYLPESYKQDIRESTSGLFYKRNILGLWCMAEGAIYECFDPKYHVVSKPPECADYWIAGIDYGSVNPFCCLLIGVHTGIRNQRGKKLWVEKEFYWNPEKTKRQLTNGEFADKVQEFLADYSVKALYIDPSAASFKLELRKRGIHVTDADNDVYNGIQKVAGEIQSGNLVICDNCPNLIKEIEGYVWDSRKAEKGEDEPMKGKGILDHACDALRYAIYTHIVPRQEESDGKTLGGGFRRIQ